MSAKWYAFGVGNEMPLLSLVAILLEGYVEKHCIRSQTLLGRAIGRLAGL